jgi:hypothetical protein
MILLRDKERRSLVHFSCGNSVRLDVLTERVMDVESSRARIGCFKKTTGTVPHWPTWPSWKGRWRMENTCAEFADQHDVDEKILPSSN